MRILADENFPRPVVYVLRREGHDVLWARTDCPGAGDRALLERAEAEGRLLLTLDKDFRQLALGRPVRLKRSGVLLFRVYPAVAELLEPLVLAALGTRHLWRGHVSTVTKDGIEMIATAEAAERGG